MKALGKVFVGAAIPEAFRGAEVINAEIDKKARTMGVLIALDKVVASGEIKKLKKSIKEYYNLKECSLSFVFNEAEATKEFFSAYHEHLLYILGEREPIYKYMLLGSRMNFSENVLTLSAVHGGVEMLKEKKCADLIKRIVLDETGLSVGVEFSDEKEEVKMPVLETVTVTEKKPEKEVKKTVAKTVSGKLILGKPIKGEIMKIADITEETDKLIIKGDVLGIDTRELRSKKVIVKFILTDGTSSISCKFFTTGEALPEIMAAIKGATVCVQGEIRNDPFEREETVSVRSIEKAEKKVKTDDEPVKRVELHCHTQMSAMDAVCSATAVVKRAISWGMKAVAITDHGVVQAYPEALKAKGDNPIKIIYGVEGYLVPDTIGAVTNHKPYNINSEVVIFDIETTGLDKNNDAITEIGAVKVKDGKITDRFSTFVDPKRHIPEKITELTGITDEMVSGAPDREKGRRRLHFVLQRRSRCRAQRKV